MTTKILINDNDIAFVFYNKSILRPKRHTEDRVIIDDPKGMENPSCTHEKQTEKTGVPVATDQPTMGRRDCPQRRARASTETEDDEDDVLSLVNDDDSEGEYVDKYFQTRRKPHGVLQEAIEVLDSDEDMPILMRREQEDVEILDVDEYTPVIVTHQRGSIEIPNSDEVRAIPTTSMPDVNLTLEDLDTETIIEIARAAPQPLLPVRPRRNAFSRFAPCGFRTQSRELTRALVANAREENDNKANQKIPATSSNSNSPATHQDSQAIDDDSNELDCVDVVGSGPITLICLLCDKNPDTEPPFSDLITLNTGDERQCPNCFSTGQALEACTKSGIRACWVPEGEGPVRLYCRRCKNQEILKTGQRTKCTHCCEVLDWEADKKQEWFWEAIFGKEAKEKLEEWNDVLVAEHGEDLGVA